MNTKKKMSNKSIRGVIWHDIERGFYADRFRYLIAVLMLAGVLIILGNHEFGMMDTIFFMQGGYDPVLIIKEGKIVFPFVWMLIQFLVPLISSKQTLPAYLLPDLPAIHPYSLIYNLNNCSS